jgi:UDP-3-O-[3-hydroxymyristoyl] N-acetylglucosamine deacetylase
MDQRQTLKRSVDIKGTGLHSGQDVQLTLKPAPCGHGLRFVRRDLGGEIPAHVDALARLEYATTLSHDGARVDTVEHLLAALYALGADDVLIELDGPEVPILDGSAAPFVDLVLRAGLRGAEMPRRYLKVLEPVEVVSGDKWARLSPADDLRVSYTIGFDHPLLRHQAATYRVTPHSFVAEIAPARTFGFLSEVESLRRSGLARGGSLDNAVVFGADAALTPLRFADECVRHKILDAIGDLALVGYPLLGHLEAHKAGHALHAALARKLLASPQAFCLTSEPQPLRTPVPAAAQLALQAL